MLTKEQRDYAISMRFECGAIPSAIAKKLHVSYVEVRDLIKEAERVARRSELVGFDDSYPVDLTPREVSYPPRFVRHNELMTLCPI